MIGTGRILFGTRTAIAFVLKRNYAPGPKQRGQSAVPHDSSAPARVAALLAGDVQMIEGVQLRNRQP